jgi:hypothetical protein
MVGSGHHEKLLSSKVSIKTTEKKVRDDNPLTFRIPHLLEGVATSIFTLSL